MLTHHARSMLDDLNEDDSYIEIEYLHSGKLHMIRGVYQGLARYRDGRWTIIVQPGDGWSRQYEISKINNIRRLDK